MPAAQRTVEIAVPPDQLMAVITDFPSYPTFLPDMEQVEVLREGGGLWEVRFSVFVVRRFQYTLRLVRPDPLHLNWSLVEGAFLANDGGWELSPIDDGSRTRASYRIDLQVGMYVPGNIVRSLVDRSLPDTLARFKAEAERRG